MEGWFEGMARASCELQRKRKIRPILTGPRLKNSQVSKSSNVKVASSAPGKKSTLAYVLSPSSLPTSPQKCAQRCKGVECGDSQCMWGYPELRPSCTSPRSLRVPESRSRMRKGWCRLPVGCSSRVSRSPPFGNPGPGTAASMSPAHNSVPTSSV